MQTKEILKKRCNTMLVALLGSKLLADGWWNMPNKAFNGLTPEGQWMLDHEIVYNYLLSHVDGSYH